MSPVYIKEADPEMVIQGSPASLRLISEENIKELYTDDYDCGFTIHLELVSVIMKE